MRTKPCQSLFFESCESTPSGSSFSRFFFSNGCRNAMMAAVVLVVMLVGVRYDRHFVLPSCFDYYEL